MYADAKRFSRYRTEEDELSDEVGVIATSGESHESDSHPKTTLRSTSTTLSASPNAAPTALHIVRDMIMDYQQEQLEIDKRLSCLPQPMVAPSHHILSVKSPRGGADNPPIVSSTTKKSPRSNGVQAIKRNDLSASVLCMSVPLSNVSGTADIVCPPSVSPRADDRKSSPNSIRRPSRNAVGDNNSSNVSRVGSSHGGGGDSSYRGGGGLKEFLFENSVEAPATSNQVVFTGNTLGNTISKLDSVKSSYSSALASGEFVGNFKRF